jgi:hypothetical protein
MDARGVGLEGAAGQAGEGLVLVGPDGLVCRVAGDLARLPGATGYHRLVDPGTAATLALTPLPAAPPKGWIRWLWR